MSEAVRELNVQPHEALLLTVRVAAGRVAGVDKELARVLAAHDGDMTHPEVQLLLRTSRMERSLLSKTAKAAVEAGVAERLVRQVELEGQLVANALHAVLGVLPLAPEWREYALRVAQAQLGVEAGQPPTELPPPPDVPLTIISHARPLADGPGRSGLDSPEDGPDLPYKQPVSGPDAPNYRRAPLDGPSGPPPPSTGVSAPARRPARRPVRGEVVREEEGGDA
jgi:hypothetical protein